MENEIIREHYYGDAVRTLFIITGVVMLVMLPFFASLIKAPIILSIVGILALAIFGGFLNPKQLWIIVINTLISIGAFAIFEYYAVLSYINPTSNIQLATKFFWVNQTLALLFFIAVYLSVKSLRGKMTK